jgi:hypothetical protein
MRLSRILPVLKLVACTILTACGLPGQATLDGLAKQSDPAIGAITTMIDESVGADKLVAKPEITTVNDLKGKKIAFSTGSVGEYFLMVRFTLVTTGGR